MAGPGPGLKSRLKPIGEFRKDLFRFFLPPLCAVCDRALAPSETWLCRSCHAGLAAEAGQRDREIDLGGGEKVRVLFSLPYSRAVSRVVKDMKYRDRPGLAEVLSPFLALALSSSRFVRPLLVPVPLHAAKRRERGYNQSQLLSAGVSRLTGIPAQAGALLRVKNTPAQAGLDGERRLHNLRRAFEASPGAPLAGRHTILVDDVVTTGATLAACAVALRAAGVVEVTACALASSA
jgi:ComF family protein